MWQCGTCNYVWEEEEPPDQCPKCGAKREKHFQLDAKRVDLVERSRFTNGLHMQLFSLMEQVVALAEDGIDDNLDPPCVRIFRRALEHAEFTQQAIKAELQGHMGKGKWG